MIAGTPTARPASSAGGPTPAPPLVRRLGEALRAHGVVYCQWKGHGRPQRWATGVGDIDFLVDRRSLDGFAEVAARLGFKLALPRPGTLVPGQVSYFGFDPQLQRLVHLHVHCQLIVGSYWTATYRIPIEAAVLATSVPGDVFNIPTAEFGLILAALRTVQHYSPGAVLRPEARRLADARDELGQLCARVTPARLREVLREHLPVIDQAFFERCLKSVDPDVSSWERLRLRAGLHRRLRAHVRQPGAWTAFATRARWALTLGGRLGRAAPSPKRFLRGGVVLALVGGDGAGKSTSVRALFAWLSGDFAVMQAHLGRPPRSLVTLLVGGALKVSTWLARLGPAGRPSYLELLRTVCTARDRYNLYVSARRFAAAGGIALCERYPVAQNRSIVGPGIPALLEGISPSRLATLLLEWEASYYRRILPPDVLLVLRVHPEIAVRRKTDEPADYVRTRARIVWNTHWTGTRAHLVNADRSFADVVDELKAIIWAEL